MLLCQLTIVFAQGHLNATKLNDFEKYLQNEINTGQIGGIEVLISQQNEIVWHKTLGYSNAIKKTPLEENSIYYLQSMTKPIISVAIMQLVEKGLINLEDKAKKYVPELADLKVIIDENNGIDSPTVERESDITIHQLLTHTAGFSHGLGETKFDKELFKLMYNELFDPADHVKLEERLAGLFSVPLIGQPGEKWHYSASPDVLALILQRVSKQPINDYLNTHIFTPLEMNETGYNVPEKETNRVMLVHMPDQNGALTLSPLQVPLQGNTVYGGTHGLFSSMKDYLRFCQMLLNGGALGGQRVLNPETVKMMQQNQVGERIGLTRGFGYGFGVLYNTDDDPSPANSGQFYWGGFFKTHFFIDPKAELIAILMTQKFPNSEEYIVALNRAVYGAIE